MKQWFSRGIVLSVLVLSLSNCKKDYSNSNGYGGGAPNPPPSGPDIDLSSSATLGQYLTNSQGQALYMFSDEVDGVNACTGDCAAIWPEFTADLTTAKLNAGLNIADFDTITTANGKKQVTYKGWPLHTYSPLSTGGYGGSSNVPEGPGTTRGDGFAGVWFVAKPDYTIMLADKQLKGLDTKNYKSDFTLGNGKTIYFTNGVGRTIYTFSLDSFNINKFTKADLSNNNVFPIYEQTNVVIPSALDKTLFGNIGFAGKQQLTYKGWPLHFFGQDSVRGLTLAVSVPVAGKWPVAVKDIGDPKR
jgi:predicted lipoprotein with Yx(FWY)xxD motif